MWFGRLISIFAGIIIFIILLVVLLTHGGKKPQPNPIQPLPSYAGTNAQVSFTTDGMVNADQLHRSIRITVTNSEITLDVLKGYNPQIIRSKTFQNNQEAYTVFLKAINNSGFLAKTSNKKIPDDDAGQCPLGTRYILDLNNEGSDLSRTWASSCGSNVGTSKAALGAIQTLFQAQVPGYDTLTSDVDLFATAEQ
ncbi:MAG TPA: hypothetical protein VFJ84_02195 [Candidatus Saccharimonadales bacterium]|nr:hypothetical protein [Candidatus Saccharimonadales bacterium]